MTNNHSFTRRPLLPLHMHVDAGMYRHRYGHFMGSCLLLPLTGTSPIPMFLPFVRHGSASLFKQRCLVTRARTISTTPEPHAYLSPLLTATADAKSPELDRVMTLMLNRPATKNALTVQMVSVCALLVRIASTLYNTEY